MSWYDAQELFVKNYRLEGFTVEELAKVAHVSEIINKRLTEIRDLRLDIISAGQEVPIELQMEEYLLSRLALRY